MREIPSSIPGAGRVGEFSAWIFSLSARVATDRQGRVSKLVSSLPVVLPLQNCKVTWEKGYLGPACQGQPGLRGKKSQQKKKPSSSCAQDRTWIDTCGVGSLAVGCRTRNRKVAGSSPARARRCVLGKGTLHEFSSLHPGVNGYPAIDSERSCQCVSVKALVKWQLALLYASQEVEKVSEWLGLLG